MTVNNLFIAAVNVAFNKVITAEHRVKQIKFYCAASTWSSTENFEPGKKILGILCLLPVFDSVSEAAKVISDKMTLFKDPLVLVTQSLINLLYAEIFPVSWIEKEERETYRNTT